MNPSESILQKIERALSKAASKFPADDETLPLTDIALQVKQDSGELLIFDDDDVELTRCVVDEWIGNTSETFYSDVEHLLRSFLAQRKDLSESFNVLRPYSFILVDDEKETIAELYDVDDDTIVISGPLMDGLQEDLDAFWAELEKE